MRKHFHDSTQMHNSIGPLHFSFFKIYKKLIRNYSGVVFIVSYVNNFHFSSIITQTQAYFILITPHLVKFKILNLCFFIYEIENV